MGGSQRGRSCLRSGGDPSADAESVIREKSRVIILMITPQTCRRRKPPPPPPPHPAPTLVKPYTPRSVSCSSTLGRARTRSAASGRRRSRLRVSSSAVSTTRVFIPQLQPILPICRTTFFPHDPNVICCLLDEGNSPTPTPFPPYVAPPYSHRTQI